MLIQMRPKCRTHNLTSKTEQKIFFNPENDNYPDKLFKLSTVVVAIQQKKPN
jgi:hypothetical protein